MWRGETAINSEGGIVNSEWGRWQLLEGNGGGLLSVPVGPGEEGELEGEAEEGEGFWGEAQEGMEGGRG